jgi:hypothetical protein
MTESKTGEQNGEQEKCPVYVKIKRLREFQLELKKETEEANTTISEEIQKLESELRVKLGAIERFHFDRKHGENIFVRGRHLYASGAQWNPKNLHYDPDIEPPPTPDLWVLQVEFLDVKIEGLLAERTKIQNAVAYQNSRAAGGADELYGHWREDLKKIKTELASLRSKRSKLDHKVAEQDENRQRQQRLDEAEAGRRSEVSLSKGGLNRM